MADNTVNSPAPGSWIERRFALHTRGSTVRTECLAGLTGFRAAAYLLVVIPGHDFSVCGRYAADGVLRQPAVYCRAGHWWLGAGRGNAGGE